MDVSTFKMCRILCRQNIALSSNISPNACGDLMRSVHEININVNGVQMCAPRRVAVRLKSSWHFNGPKLSQNI